MQVSNVSIQDDGLFADVIIDGELHTLDFDFLNLLYGSNPDTMIRQMRDSISEYEIHYHNRYYDSYYDIWVYNSARAVILSDKRKDFERVIRPVFDRMTMILNSN